MALRMYFWGNFMPLSPGTLLKMSKVDRKSVGKKFDLFNFLNAALASLQKPFNFFRKCMRSAASTLCKKMLSLGVRQLGPKGPKLAEYC